MARIKGDNSSREFVKFMALFGGLDGPRVIDHPHAAAVAGDRQHVVARVDLDVPDGRIGQPGAEIIPAFRAVGRDIDAEIGSGIQHVAVLGILPNDIDRPARQILRQKSRPMRPIS